VSWEPLAQYLITTSGPEKFTAGTIATLQVRYSLSYVDDNNVFLYSQIPSTTNSRISSNTSSYNQNLNLSFVSADHDGQYTPTALNIGGVSIPANSVYRAL